ncbi:MAG: TIGR03936 family radical SAM-associated protein [Oscillospiraceae bacterium]|nr:TIGR03936 family radical SAM-associated protein [Oscillospiraceae bacterium]
MDKLRLRFVKRGRAVYISHLDLMRTMQRAFLRAGYALKYSEGFNPHPVISILLPLGVGCASDCELMDFSLTEPAELSLLPERLTAAMPEGIEALEAYSGGRKGRELKWLKLAGTLEYDSGDTTTRAAALTEFFRRDALVIRKKTKRGFGESDIAPAIRALEFRPAAGAVTLTGIVSAQEPTLNPTQLISALEQLAPEIAPDFAEFRRLEVYDAEMQIFR